MEAVGLGREFELPTDRDMQFRDDKSSRRISVMMQNVTYQLLIFFSTLRQPFHRRARFLLKMKTG